MGTQVRIRNIMFPHHANAKSYGMRTCSEMDRWMRIDCHAVCLQGRFNWPFNSPIMCQPNKWDHPTPKEYEAIRIAMREAELLGNRARRTPN